jgi:hypothetical protein
VKYTRLTKEQFEELHQEFINFLASQSITKAEWDKIKEQQPHVADQELDVFSDLIWEGVLNNSQYLEHFSKEYIFLFKCELNKVYSIVIKSLEKSVDFTNKEGLAWLGDHIFTDSVELQLGSKTITDDRNTFLFDIIKQGAIISDGYIYNQIDQILLNQKQ